MRVPAVDLRWELRLASTPITGLMNLMLKLMPAALLRSDLVLTVMSAMATALLGAGRFRLRGRVPNRQWFQAGPRKIFMVPEARASIGGRALGALGPLAEQASLGDFALPQRGLVMLGSVSFEAYAPGLHLPATREETFRPAFAAR